MEDTILEMELNAAMATLGRLQAEQDKMQMRSEVEDIEEATRDVLRKWRAVEIERGLARAAKKEALRVLDAVDGMAASYRSSPK